MVKQEALISSMQVMARSIDELKRKDQPEPPSLIHHEAEPEIQIQIQKPTKRRKLDDTSWRDEIVRINYSLKLFFVFWLFNLCAFLFCLALFSCFSLFDTLLSSFLDVRTSRAG